MTRTASRSAASGHSSTYLILLLVLFVFATFTLPAAADGILVPTKPDAPNFAIKYHRVDVKIESQIATTSIDQVFENRTNREQEAVYLFPLPKGASVRKFTLYDAGHALHAELLDRDKAREIYESIVRKRKDPGLLEYIGRDTYRVSVFPIPARGTKRIQLEYTEFLEYDSGVVTYNYPLSTEKFSSAPIEEVKVNIAIESRNPINTVYSPTHELKMDKPDAHTAFASLEEHGTKPNMDLLLHYTVSEEDLGTSVLTYKEAGEDGFFLLMGAPSAALADRAPQPKDVVFVLDKSGSMSGEKIEQAKGALQFFLNSLNAKDRFRIIIFSSSVRTLGEGKELLSASRENLRSARAAVEKIKAQGGTDINSALKTALDLDFDRTGAAYIVFLTDGLPTVGNTDINSIIKNVRSANTEAKSDKRRTRLFVFGAGFDVNTIFLEKLSQDNGGLAEYVRPSEDIEVKVSRFFAKVAQPMLTDLALDINGIETYDIFPKEMPDLFAGSQLIVMGRYRTTKTVNAKVSVSGYASPRRKAFDTRARFYASQPENDYIAPLWASRKIGFLLDEIQIHGKSEELVKEITDLSTTYGILTEYTAFLAEEGARDMESSELKARVHGPLKAAMALPSGARAAAQRGGARGMRTQSNLAQQNAWVDASGRSFRYSQAQTRNNRGFFQRGQRWEDARYKEGQQRVVRVRAYSEAYFQISRRAPHLNQYLTMGENVLFVVNGQAVEIAEDGKEEFTEKELDELLGKQKAPAKRAFAAPQEQLVGAGILAAVPPAGGSVAALLLAVSIGVGALVVKAKSRLM